MKFHGFELDNFQEEAVKAIESNDSVVVSAPTGSGKTLVADFIIDKYVKKEQRIVYTAPIKALSNQKYKDFCNDYGEDNIGLITGDLVINPSAKVLIMTTEVYRNMAILEDPILDSVSYCIMDEIHFISDEERGYIWEESIIFSPLHIKFLFLSATIPNAKEFAGWVQSIKEHSVKVISSTHRPVPLERKFYDQILGITTLQDIRSNKHLDQYPDYHDLHRRRGRRHRAPPPSFRDLIKTLWNEKKLPCIYFVLSRAKTQEFASQLAGKLNLLTPSQQVKASKIVSDEMRKVSSEVLSLSSTRDMRFCLMKGIAFHNAGLLPEIKHVVEILFAKGLIQALFATETFAVGINMPAKTVCFDSLRKYTKSGFRYFSSKEYFQMAGRAGRRGIDKKGYAIAVVHRPSLEIDTIERITSGDTEPLKSQFQITPNTVLNMIQLHAPEEVSRILTMNFFSYQKLKGNTNKNRVLGTIKARFTKLIKTLNKLQYLKGGRLTALGQFASKVFINEIEVTECFARKKHSYDEYDTLLIVASLVYEGKRGARFYRTFDPKKISKILRIFESNNVLKRLNIANQIEKMSAVVGPMVQGKKFIEILKNTNMPEGDLIRLLMRMIDLLDQIDRAIVDDDNLRSIVRNSKEIIKDSLEGLQLV